jgi:LEA14-like dessication related protein
MIKSLYKKTVMAGAVFCIVFILTTCQTLQSMIRDPIVSLQSVELAKITFTGVDLLCKVKVENPNPIEIPFPEVSWNLFINTNDFIGGVIKNDQSLRSRGATVIDVLVNMDYLGVFNTFKSLKGSKQADYKIALAAKFNLPILGEKTWRFEHEGDVPVPQMPKFSMPSMKIDKLDFTRAELLFTFNVENPNVFELPALQMDYDYQVSRNSFITSSIETGGALAAAAVTPVAIRLGVNYANLYQSFQSLRNSAEAPSLLALAGVVAIPALADDALNLEIPGSLPLLKVPSLSFKGIKVTNLALTKIDFELSWEIENNNNFAMSVNDFSYNFAVNNSPWVNGKVPGAPQITAGRKTTVPLPFSINSLSMVRDITDIITRGTEVAYACSGNINLGAALQALDDFTFPYNYTGRTKIAR